MPVIRTIAVGLATSAVWAYVVKPYLEKRDQAASQRSAGPITNAYDELHDPSPDNPLRSV